MDNKRYQDESRPGGVKPGKAALLLTAAFGLAACGGGGGSSGGGDGGDGGGDEPSTPADMRMHAALVLTELMDARDLQYDPAGLLGCPGGGSSSTEAIVVSGPYGDANGEAVRFNDCRSGDNVVNGELATATDAGQMVYLRGGAPDGTNPFTHHMDVAGVTLEISGEQHICPNCGGGTNPTTRESALKLSTTSATRATLSLGKTDQPLQDWIWPDQPAAGQVTYRIIGALDYQVEGGCRVGPADYRSSDSQPLVYDIRGGVFQSGLLRITTAGGNEAEVAFSASEATITMAGVSESYSYKALVDAYNDHCDLSWPAPGVPGGPGGPATPTPIGP